MEVFRIVKEDYSTKLASSGIANRWNLDNQFVIYAGSSRSLATLELVVHRNAIKPSFAYKVMVISIADPDGMILDIPGRALPENWRRTDSYPVLQQIGSEWYQSEKSLILKVPSAVIPQEFNFVINTRHPDFAKQVSIVRAEEYFWDLRLL